MIKVVVDGHGTFEIDASKIGELLGWLSANRAVAIRQENTIREVDNNQYTGRELITG